VPVEEIVDFEEEMALFQKMLDGTSGKRIMFIGEGRGGRGKTWLLHLMRHRCEGEGIPCVYINFEGESYDQPHFSLAREICLGLGLKPQPFPGVLEAHNLLGGGGTGISFEGRARDLRVDKAAGGHIIERSQIAINLTVSAELLRQRWVRDQMNRVFLDDLSELLAEKGKAVCLFDSLEQADDQEELWLIRILLGAVREVQLPGLIVITAGRRYPDLEADWEWGDIALYRPEISLFTEKHVKEYAERKGMAISDEKAREYWLMCKGGVPILMGMVIKMARVVEGGHD
jgi:hypothetical protein